MATADRTGSGREALASVLLPCSDLDATLAFFTNKLGFRLDVIFPADRPRVAEISGYGVRLRLEQDGAGDPGVLRLLCNDASLLAMGVRQLTAPNGTIVQLVEQQQELVLPPQQPSFMVRHMRDDPHWQVGRAGMRYRDLIPDRQGGRTIASHIHIPQGGVVPDYVHFHKVHFQMIFCHRGWVRVVYEDQGEPFVMQAGDCVLQPPGIRHRVLESSPGLEVLEISCPAEHETHADHDLILPSQRLDPDRRFAGQRFLRHVAADAAWRDSRWVGLQARDTGIAAATQAVASAHVLKPSGTVSPHFTSHNAAFLFTFVLQGSVHLLSAGNSQALLPGDCFVVPAGQAYALRECAPDLELLEVALPGEFETAPHPRSAL